MITVLKKARKLLSNPKKWTKNVYAKTKKGAACDPTSPSATCFCAVGAIQRYAKGDFNLATATELAVGEQTRELFGTTVVGTNDTLPRGRLKVLKAFDATIAKLEAK